jgi:pimeloyl-ACP methyl ester carboxylesterase
MPIVTLPSGDLHYLESGRGAPLILLHANPGDSRDFDAVLPTLAGNYRVLALDWPGYGGSVLHCAGTTVNAGFFCQVLRDFLAALDLPPALIVGNSLGGNVAARLAIESPGQVRGLVLVSPGGFTRHTPVTRAFCRLQGSRFALSPRAFAGWYLKHRTPVVRAMLERAATSQAAAESLALSRSVWRGFIEPENDLRARAASITAPTLLVFGARDPVISARRDGRLAVELIPRGKLVVMPSGHAPFAEMPEAFLAEVLPFLDRCARAGDHHEG